MSDVPEFDMNRKKRAKKPVKKAAQSPAKPDAGAGEQQAGTETQKADDYDYDYLLKRAFELIGQQGNDKKKGIKVPIPQAYGVGTKKTLWANFPLVCKSIHRPPEHLLTYICVELGTTANLDGTGRLVISGRYMQKNLEKLLRSYLEEYVTCKTCGSRDTTLCKENRLWFVKCGSAVCGSSRTVAAHRKGYVHTLKRKK